MTPQRRAHGPAIGSSTSGRALRSARSATVVSENAAQLSTIFSSTLGGPLIKTAACTYGVRKAVAGKKKGK